MGIIFFLVVTPTGLFMRLLKKDLLRLKKTKDKTYWIEFNDKYAEDWPNLVRRKAAPDDADDWQNVPDKMKYFDETPAEKA